MKTINEVIKALKCCKCMSTPCYLCPYMGHGCIKELSNDALGCIQTLKEQLGRTANTKQLAELVAEWNKEEEENENEHKKL